MKQTKVTELKKGKATLEAKAKKAEEARLEHARSIAQLQDRGRLQQQQIKALQTKLASSCRTQQLNNATVSMGMDGFGQQILLRTDRRWAYSWPELRALPE